MRSFHYAVGRVRAVMDRFYIDAFMIGIFAMVGVAAVLPASGTGEQVLDWAVKIAIGLLFFLYGARLSPREALQGFTHWRLHTTVLAFTFVLFPLIGLALRVLAPHIISDELYTGILFMTLVPSTVQSSIAFTSIARGNVAGSIVSASFSNLIGVFLTPLLVILLMDTTGEAEISAQAIIDIVIQLLVPFIAGQLARPLLVGFLTRYAAPTKIVDRGSILLVVYAAFSEGMNQGIWSMTSVSQIFIVVGISCAILAVVIWLTGHVSRWLKFSWPDQIVIVFCGSKKSLASGLPMASVLFAGQPVGLIVLPLMIFHQIQLMVCAVLARRYAAKSIALEEQAAAARAQAAGDEAAP